MLPEKLRSLIASTLQATSEAFSLKSDFVTKCFTKYNNNANKFADCIKDESTNIYELQAKFESKLMFTSLKYEDCLKSKDEAACFDESSKLWKGISDDFTNQINKL